GAVGLWSTSDMINGVGTGKKLYLASNNNYANPEVTINAGNVGIGTTGPGATLDIAGSTGATAFRVTSSGTQNLPAYIENTVNTAGYHGLKIKVANAAAGTLPFYVDVGANRVFQIQGDGNVGIGTTNPGGKLIVKGAGTTTGVNFQTQNSSGTALVTALDSGNIGIGTTTPSAKLEVAGSFKATAGGSTINLEDDGDVMIGI
ncbi:MAG: hypothetical protein V1851_00600, partial [Patescibacteria group bacterium]